MKTPAPSTQRPLITDFEKHRDFLKAMFDYFKKNHRGFSYAQIANKAGVSRSYLKHILDGRRNIGTDRIGPIAKAFRLSKEETDYFSIWVLRSLTKELSVRKYLDSILQKLAQQIIWNLDRAIRPSSPQAEATLSNLLFATICELVRFPDFKPESTWILTRLIDRDRFSTENVEQALKWLIEKKL